MKKSVWLVGVLGVGLLVGCGGGDDSSGATKSGDKAKLAVGKKIYREICTECHGLKGQGVEDKGITLKASKFIKERTDDELLAYVKQGRTKDDPLNTSGLEMPPKAGPAELTAAQLLGAGAYIRAEFVEGQ
jgi:mono/diheme cytochrome c family protein